MVGPNEAGKSALLEALQQINPPTGVRKFDVLRDYPRSEYNDITTGRVKPDDVTVVEGHFSLDSSDVSLIGSEFKDCTYVFGRKLDNSAWHRLAGGPVTPVFGDVKKDLIRLAAHIDRQVSAADEARPSAALTELTRGWADSQSLDGDYGSQIKTSLEAILPHIDENNADEEKRYDRLIGAVGVSQRRSQALQALNSRLPVFVLFSNYFRVKPLIHLEHLATRIESNVLDDDYYDYGNKCLLQLLGFTPRELSNLGKVAEPASGDAEALQSYRDQLDRRSYQLNAASIKLTNEIRGVWNPDPKRAEADRLRVIADAQYLKVVVEDELGVEIELDQRSQGFQ